MPRASNRSLTMSGFSPSLTQLNSASSIRQPYSLPVFLDYPEFHSRQYIHFEMQVSAAYDSSPFGDRTKLQYRNGFVICLVPRFVSTHDSFFYLSLAAIFAVHFQLCNSSALFAFQLGRRSNYCALENRF